MRKNCMPFIGPLALLVACSGASETTSSGSSALSGPIDVRLANETDGDESPPANTATQVVVTITRVDAKLDEHQAPGDDDRWVTLAMSTTTLDLLAVPFGGFTRLAVAQLPAGGIDRLRLFVSPTGANYVVTADGVHHDLVVPSGAVDVVGDFDVAGCATGQVTLAFAGKKSVFVHALADGTSEWALRPVIRVREAKMTGAGCDKDDKDRHAGSQ